MPYLSEVDRTDQRHHTDPECPLCPADAVFVESTDTIPCAQCGTPAYLRLTGAEPEKRNLGGKP